MKKYMGFLGICLMLIAAIAMTASTLQEKNENANKEKHQNKGKQKQDKKGDKDKDEDKGNKEKNDHYQNKGDDHDMNKGNRDNNDRQYGRKWNREDFNDRKNIKRQDKVSICHKFNSNDESPVTINVSANAVKAHMNHGDVMGDCPVTNRKLSDRFFRNRTDYYNNLQASQEQVYYSQSVLDYALARLTNSRLQLRTMQSNNLPLADVQRKQATVTELEQNVSLLEILLNTAANIVTNKLQL